MARADWTHEVAPAGADAAGLEEYLVESASGERIGKVQTLLRRDSELLVAVERGTPPATHDVRVFPWNEVAHVDHDALTVHLRVGDEAVEEALELDPDKGVEGAEADAVRVTEAPVEPGRYFEPAPGAGPVDRPTYAVALGLAAAGLFAFLVVVMATAGLDGDWKFALFAIPALLLAAAGAVGYRVWRAPYERR